MLENVTFLRVNKRQWSRINHLNRKVRSIHGSVIWTNLSHRLRQHSLERFTSGTHEDEALVIGTRLRRLNGDHVVRVDADSSEVNVAVK